jgi:hypothetical protein
MCYNFGLFFKLFGLFFFHFFIYFLILFGCPMEGVAQAHGLAGLTLEPESYLIEFNVKHN